MVETRIDAITKSNGRLHIIEYKTLQGSKYNDFIKRVTNDVNTHLKQGIINAFLFMCNTHIVPETIQIVFIERKRACVHQVRMPFDRKDMTVRARRFVAEVILNFVHANDGGTMWIPTKCLTWNGLNSRQVKIVKS